MDRKKQIKRLRIRSWRRGFKELDLLLGTFADKAIEKLDPNDLDEYEKLLMVDDYVVYSWLTGKEECWPQMKSIVVKIKSGMSKSM